MVIVQYVKYIIRILFVICNIVGNICHFYTITSTFIYYYKRKEKEKIHVHLCNRIYIFMHTNYQK